MGSRNMRTRYTFLRWLSRGIPYGHPSALHYFDPSW